MARPCALVWLILDLLVGFHIPLIFGSLTATALYIRYPCKNKYHISYTRSSFFNFVYRHLHPTSESNCPPTHYTRVTRWTLLEGNGLSRRYRWGFMDPLCDSTVANVVISPRDCASFWRTEDTLLRYLPKMDCFCDSSCPSLYVNSVPSDRVEKKKERKKRRQCSHPCRRSSHFPCLTSHAIRLTVPHGCLNSSLSSCIWLPSVFFFSWVLSRLGSHSTHARR